MEYVVSYFNKENGGFEQRTFYTRAEALHFVSSAIRNGFEIGSIQAVQTVRTHVDITLDELNSYETIIDEFAHI